MDFCCWGLFATSDSTLILVSFSGTLPAQTHDLFVEGWAEPIAVRERRPRLVP